MGYVVRIEWLGGLSDKRSSIHTGRYVARYDPDAHDGRGHVGTTLDPRVALQFDSHKSAVEFYLQTSTIQPVRDDGKPNRPLTAFTVSIFDWERE